MAPSLTIPPITKKQITETGLLVVAGCLVTGLYQEQAIWYKAALASTMLTLVVPQLFFPLAVVWFTLGHYLGKITAKLLLVLLFVGLVVPIAWLRKLLGSDTLRAKQFKKNSDSVFISREHTFQASDLKYPF